MKKFTILIILILTGMISRVYGDHPFAGGSGTETDPYLVETAEQLNEVRNYLDAWFRQTDDISLEPYSMGAGWTPIGGNGTDLRFTGHYDGGGHIITDLTIMLAGVSNVGLFGHVGEGGTVASSIKNLGLVNVSVIGGRGTGALIGRITGNQNTRIENCYVSGGTVTGDGATGGLAGSNNSYMTNAAAAESFRPVIHACWTNVSVQLRDAESPGKDKFGGLAGCNQKGLVSNSYARGSVHVPGGFRVGGLVGCVELRGITIDSYSTGLVTGEGATLIGGLVGMVGTGRNEGTVSRCYWDINTSGQPTSAAGAGLTTAQMKTAANFVGWDFDINWELKPEENDGYPVLREMYNPETIWIWQTDGTPTWTNPDNWNQETVPNALSVVQIPAGGIQPFISSHENIYSLFIADEAFITIENNASLTVSGGLESGALGNAEITGEGEFILSGSQTLDIPGMTFNRLSISNINNVRLTGNIHITDYLNMETGLLDLNGQIINLAPGAELQEVESENSSSRVFGQEGYISLIGDISMYDGNIAGLGLELDTHQPLGIVTIRRGHSELNGTDNSKSILRWFDIIPQEGHNSDLNATLVFHYFTGEINIVDEAHNFALFKSVNHIYTDGDEWLWIPSEVDAANRKITATHVETFSRWTAGSSDNPLPVSLLSFDAQVAGDEVLLEWVTATEINNDFFTIERSRNGTDFETVGFVSGAGTVNQMQYYRLWDSNPIAGLSYYRLKQTDLDGTFEYFSPVSVYVKSDNQAEVVIYPNPNNGKFSIYNPLERETGFRVYDIRGRVVHSSTAGPSFVSMVNIDGVTPGLYTVVFYGDEVVSQKMLVR